MKNKSSTKYTIVGMDPGNPVLTSTFVRKFYLPAFSASFGALIFGFCIGFTSPALPQLISSGIVNEDQASWIGSILNLGALLGVPFAGLIVEKLGRRPGLLLACCPFVIGWLMIYWSHGLFSLLLIGRTLTGFGCGMVSGCSSIYIAETAPSIQRGYFGSFVQLSITLGIAIIYFLGLFWSWQSLALCGAVTALLNAFLVYAFLPETPRWLLLKHRRKESQNSLALLRGNASEEEFLKMEECIDSDNIFSFSEFRNVAFLRAFKVSLALMFFQQFSGINVIMFYSKSIISDVGMKESSSIVSVALAGIQVIFTLVASCLLDRTGRRKLLIIASIGMALGCITLSIAYTSSGTFVSFLALSGVLVYIIAFSLGWGPVPMLVTAEIFQSHIRGSASALCTTANWFFAFLITKEFHWFEMWLGSSAVFALFGVCCICSIGFVFKSVPETKGKSLEDIELFFLGRPLRNV